VLGRFYGQEILGGSFPTVTAEKLSKHFCSTTCCHSFELQAEQNWIWSVFLVCVILCTPYISHMVWSIFFTNNFSECLWACWIIYSDNATLLDYIHRSGCSAGMVIMVLGSCRHNSEIVWRAHNGILYAVQHFRKCNRITDVSTKNRSVDICMTLLNEPPREHICIKQKKGRGKNKVLKLQYQQNRMS